MAWATLPSSSSAYNMKYDLSSPNYLWGNLTWKGGVGRIVWGPATEANTEATGAGASPDPVTAAMWENSYYPRYLANHHLAPFPGPVEFESDPLPMKMYLNLSNTITLLLHVKDHEKQADPCGTFNSNSSPDFLLDVELYANGELIGGATGSNTVYWYYTNPSTKTRPTDPAGFAACYFGMAPETLMLDEGTVLRLKITRVVYEYDFPFAFGGEHPSILRVPFYTPEETLYRYPNLAEGPEEADEEPESSAGARARSDAALAPVASIGLAALGVGRKRRMGVLLGLLIVGAALSGCLASKSDKKDAEDEQLAGQATSTQIKDDLGLASGATGSILGRVHDDLHIPVGGVHVSIIGFPNFTTTDGKGQFKFLNLLPGLYKLRFDKAEYRSFETELEVKAGFVNKPDVTLYLANQKERDARQHTHDYWAPGQVTKEVANGAMARTCIGEPPRCTLVNPFRLDPKGDDPNTVMPGTLEMEIVLTFDPAAIRSDVVGLAISHPGNGPNMSIYAPRASGAPFNVKLAWEMADPGHSRFSNWHFYYWTPSGENAGYLENTRRNNDPTQPQPDLRFKIVITKGPSLPLEPGHPDVWGGATEIQTLKDAVGAYRSSTVPEGTPNAGCVTMGGTINLQTCYVKYLTAAAPIKITPPGTEYVSFKLVQSRPSSPAFGWTLLYKPANIAWHHVDATTGEGYRTAPAPSGDGTTTTWKIPVKELESDAEYATKTAWHFILLADDENAKYLDYHLGLGFYASSPSKMTLTMSAWAHKGAS